MSSAHTTDIPCAEADRPLFRSGGVTRSLYLFNEDQRVLKGRNPFKNNDFLDI